MPAQPFEADVRRQPDAQPPAAVIDLHGEINAAAEARLNAAYAEAQAQNPPTIVLNFGEVSYMNSTGIALIVGLLARDAQGQAPSARLRSQPALPGDLPDHAAGRFYEPCFCAKFRGLDSVEPPEFCTNSGQIEGLQEFV